MGEISFCLFYVSHSIRDRLSFDPSIRFFRRAGGKLYEEVGEGHILESEVREVKTRGLNEGNEEWRNTGEDERKRRKSKWN